MQELLDELKNRVDNLEKRIEKIEKEKILTEPTKEQMLTNQKKLSIKEFLIEKKPSNDVKKTLAICYYLEHFSNVTPFNADDIEGGFRLAKENPPLNINDRVNSNIRGGYIMEYTEKKNARKAWLLTASGEKFVETGFKK